jgi:hypothetical protein
MTSAECKGTWAGPLVAEERQFTFGAIGPGIAKTERKIKILAPESNAKSVPLDHE